MHDDPSSTGNEEDYPDGSQDGLKTAGYLSLPGADLTGSIAGPNKNGNFTGTIGGAISGLVITGVDELPDWFAEGDPCQEGEVEALKNLGLVGSPLSGTLSMTLTELTGSFKGEPHIHWQLDGVMDLQGGSWSLSGYSGRSRSQFFPVFEPGSTADDLTVTVEGSLVEFAGAAMTVRMCRADYTMTLAKTTAGDR